MADVIIKYKDSIIAELDSDTTSKTLKTSGKYCEGDVAVSYTPPTGVGSENVKVYDITLAKSSGWVLLTTLDADVLEHINDATLTATLTNVSAYSYTFYAGSMYIASNTPWGYNGAYPAYGFASRTQSETVVSFTPMFYPPNNTGTSTSLGGLGVFRLSGDKYYLMPSDGFIREGNYKLTFVW